MPSDLSPPVGRLWSKILNENEGLKKLPEKDCSSESHKTLFHSDLQHRFQRWGNIPDIQSSMNSNYFHELQNVIFLDLLSILSNFPFLSFFFYFGFLGPHLRHMEVLRPGFQSEL